MVHSLNSRKWPSMAAVALAFAMLGGCAASIPPVEVTRFHGEGPVAQSGGILVESASGRDADSMEFRTYASAVRQELQRIGFTDETGLQTVAASEYVAVVDFSRFYSKSGQW